MPPPMTATLAALESCRTEARAYFRCLVGVMRSPGGEWAAASASTPQARAFEADCEPFLYPLLFGGTLDEVRPHLSGVARALEREGDLTDAQILRAMGRYFRLRRRALEHATATTLPA